ncbi:hypothetical protein [Sphingomonas sp.]|uniref:hypothetical protein n=1 Tax=Sphingomonas sp. TaxID=28214 RepID=UPI0025E990B9|nr:hypothetical protein [Sphingomonas sp.]
MAAAKKPTTPARAKPAAKPAAGKHWIDAEKLLARAQKEATALLDRAQKEAAALLAKAQGAIGDGVTKTVKAAKNNPKVAAGVAVGAAATIAGGAYAASKIKSGKKAAAKPRTATAARKPAARKPAARKPAPKKS